MPTQRRAEPAELPALWELRTRAIRAGYVALRRERYPHRSGVELESVFMEKILPC